MRGKEKKKQEEEEEEKKEEKNEEEEQQQQKEEKKEEKEEKKEEEEEKKKAKEKGVVRGSFGPYGGRKIIIFQKVSGSCPFVLPVAVVRKIKYVKKTLEW